MRIVCALFNCVYNDGDAYCSAPTVDITPMVSEKQNTIIARCRTYADEEKDAE